MANLSELVQYDAGVYQLETTDPVQGGPSGVANAPLKNLANRTAWLKKHVDDLESGLTIPPGLAVVDSQAFTGTPTVPTPASGDNTKKIANTEFVQRAVNGALTKSVAGGANVTLTAAEAGYGILILTGAITANIAVIVPAVAGHWIIVNRTTGAFTVTVKTPSGTGVVVSQNRSKEVMCDGTNVIESTNDFLNTALTGSPTAPSPASGNNSTSVATTAFVWNAIDGVASINVAGGSNVTLTAAQAGSGIMRLTGALTASINVIVPTQSGQWIISNETTGNFAITAKMATGAGVVLPQGLAVVVYSDGTNVYLASSAAQNSLIPRTIAPAAGSTSITVPGGYTPGNLIVVKNGSTLDPGDFTATDSTTIALQTATIAKDTFTVFVFSSFEVANAVRKSGDVMAGALALASGSTAPTPPQFDNSISVANTAFVQRAIGNYSNAPTFLGNTTLRPEDAGKFFALGNTGTLTLPPISSVPVGATFSMQSGSSNWTVAASGTDKFAFSSTASSTIQIGNGDSLVVVSDGNFWRSAGGSAHLAYAPAFGSSKAASGYQKLPSGLIIQWAQFIQADNGQPLFYSLTLPIAFPNACLQASITVGSQINGGAVYCSAEGMTTTVVNGYTSGPAISRLYRVIAIGH